MHRMEVAGSQVIGRVIAPQSTPTSQHPCPLLSLLFCPVWLCQVVPSLSSYLLWCLSDEWCHHPSSSRLSLFLFVLWKELVVTSYHVIPTCHNGYLYTNGWIWFFFLREGWIWYLGAMGGTWHTSSVWNNKMYVFHIIRINALVRNILFMWYTKLYS